MRIGIVILTLFLFSVTSLFGQVFINEISYNDLVAANRGVELAGPAGTNLNGWYMEFRDDNNTPYHTETINTPITIDNENASGKGGIWIPISDLQDNDNNAVILFDDNNTAQDTISYGGSPFGNLNLSNIGITQSLPTVTPQNLENGNNDDVWWVLAASTKGDLNGASQLPVELISFEAIQLEKGIELKWITASEENNSHFEIEHSLDGFNYETIGIVQGNQTTIEAQTYEFIDDKMQNGQNYYRLKQVDFDAKFEYSKIIMLDYSNEISVMVAPNPVTQHTKLRITLSQYENTSFVIYDMTGKVIKVYVRIDENGITVDDLDSGLYIYQIRQNNHLLKTDKLIIID